MSVYNDGPYVEKAVNSILGQSYGNFEFIIIDDGSQDDTCAVLERLALADPRIRLYKNSENRGLIYSLNRAIELADGEYIARMDGDDISMPDRFSRQVELLDRGEVDICGAWMSLINTQRKRIIRYPETDIEIRAWMLFQTPFSHPTIMYRRSIIDAGLRYREGFVHAEDYDFYTRLGPDVRMANIPEVMLEYRQHRQQVSRAGKSRQNETARKVRIHALEQSGIDFTDAEIKVHGMCRYPVAVDSMRELQGYSAWIGKVCEHYAGNRRAQRIVAEQWYRICVRASGLGLKVWKAYHAAPLSGVFEATARQRMDLFLVCLLKLRYGGAVYRSLEKFSFSPGF